MFLEASFLATTNDQISIANAYVWSALQISTNMLQFGSYSSYILSDLYGYKPYFKEILWFNIYWTLFCVFLAAITICFWPRGKEKKLATRFKLAKLDNGKYEVTIQVSSGKLKADGQGKETEVALNDWMDIGAFARPEGQRKYGKTLYRKRVKIDQPKNTFTFIVDEKPDKAGIDPFRLLIDRNPEDNIRDINQK